MVGMGRKKGNIEMDDLTKFTARTSPALVEQMGIVIAKMRRSDVKFDRRVVPQEAAISSIILYWLEAVTAGDFGKQEAFLREWIPRYEQLLERDPPTPRAAPKPDPGPPEAPKLQPKAKPDKPGQFKVDARRGDGRKTPKKSG